MNTKDLVQRLELVQPALADDNLVPIFTCFMFKEGTVSAYNDVISIIAPLTLDIDQVALNGTILIGLLKNSTGDAEFSMNDENVQIKAGRSNYKLPYFKQEDFLFEEPDEQWVAAVSVNETLLRGLEVCLTTVSRDHSMPALMGVCFNFDKKLMFSCDGDAITQYKTEAKFNGKGVFTVPNEFCSALLKVCSETETTLGKIDFGEGWVRATLDNKFVIYGRMIENEAPLDHLALIDQTLKGQDTFAPLPMGLNEALARARVLSDPESSKTVLTIKGNKFKMETATRSMGTVNDELSIRGHLEATAAVHASLMQRSIAICDQILVADNCTAYKSGVEVLQVVSNIGE